MSAYYKRALEIFASAFDAEAVALDYAQRHPADFVKAAGGPEPKHIMECREMMRTEGMKIEAIKHWRNATGDSLKESKAAVEALV